MANANNLTDEQVKQGYSTIPGSFDPVTGQQKAATTDPLGGVRRYTGSNPTPTGESGGNLGTAADAYYNNLNTTLPNRDAIRATALSQMQSQIDAINDVYAGLTAKEKINATDRTGKTRAIGARSGDLGGDFSNAELQKTSDFNDEAMATLQAKKTAEISSVLNAVNARADALYAQQKEEALGNQEKKLAYSEQNQKEARANLATLAGHGVSLDKLTQDEYNKLIDQTGYDPMTFQSVYNASQTAANKIDYKYTSLGNGKVLRTGTKADGTPVAEQQFDYGGNNNFEIKETKDGQLLAFDKDTGKVTTVGHSSGSGSGSGASGKPLVSGGVTIPAAALKAGEDKLKAAAKGTAYTDPYVYVQAFQEWPGAPADFIKKFPPKVWINPDANDLMVDGQPLLPNALRTTKTAPAAAKKTTTGRTR
ncbi:MAG: hypothetical protein V4478_03370 [Patescibacteria group bacterium]